MVHSAEIRWFIPGPLPGDVRDWFGAGQGLTPEKARDDAYLFFPGCDTVGVKLREGKLEVKAVVSPPRPLHLGDGVNGRTDQWVKWSLGSEGLKALEDDLRQSGRWVEVRKERYLRKFSADGETPVEVPAREKPDRGCNAELTCIRVDGDPGEWFSIGFEAFGPAGGVGKTLDDTLRLFFGRHGGVPGLRLTGRESMSYPVWLATLE